MFLQKLNEKCCAYLAVNNALAFQGRTLDQELQADIEAMLAPNENGVPHSLCERAFELCGFVPCQLCAPCIVLQDNHLFVAVLKGPLGFFCLNLKGQHRWAKINPERCWKV